MIRRLLYRLGWLGILAGICLLGGARADAQPVWKQQGCDACHRFSPEAPADRRKAPDLFFAGNKFQRDWLESWLQNPVPLRPAGYVTDPGFLKGRPTVGVPHPRVDAGTARLLTEELMRLTLPDWKAGVARTEPLSKGERFQAKRLFERDYGCIACHKSVNLVGAPRGGVSGPSLLNAGRRYQADWLVHWLNTPRRFEPRGRMPVFVLPEEDLQLLVRYIMEHRRETPP